MNTENARAAILERIKGALRDVPKNETPEAWPVAREYRTVDDSDRAHVIDLFAERVADYKAVVHRVDASALVAKIAEILGQRGLKTLVIPLDLDASWVPTGVSATRDENLSNDQLDGIQGVITAATLGIAQTGTIVLDGGPAQGRRAISLIPDYHLCIVREDQVVGSVPEAVAKLEASASAPGRPITFISGPSATSDIELNRVEGVHGPRTLEVLIVGEPR